MDGAISDDLATPRVLGLLDESLRTDLDLVALTVVLDASRSLTGIDLVTAATSSRDEAEADPAIDDLVARRENDVGSTPSWSVGVRTGTDGASTGSESARQARAFAHADQLRTSSATSTASSSPTPPPAPRGSAPRCCEGLNKRAGSASPRAAPHIARLAPPPGGASPGLGGNR
jgi:hypothetical protein